MATKIKLRKVQKWYHATTLEAAQQILDCGYIMPNANQMIFLANSKEDAGFFMNARGHKEYAIFQIHRRNIEQKRLLQNPATPNMLTAVYVKPIPVDAKDIILAKDERDFTHGISGVELITEGNGKTGFHVDPSKFIQHLQNKIGMDNYNQFTSLMDAGKQSQAEQFLESKLKDVYQAEVEG